MPLPMEDGEALASLLSILSLNTNKRADIGGLFFLLKDCRPHLVFLQEVASAPFLTSLTTGAWAASEFAKPPADVAVSPS